MVFVRIYNISDRLHAGVFKIYDKGFWFNATALFHNIYIITITGIQPKVFQSRGGFVKLGHFDKHFVKNSRKKGSAGENFGVFSPRYS